jgi:ribosomal protein S18 acetylase RimI-like enzyme
MRVLSLGGPDLADLSTGILGQGGTFCFRARGASMAPFIRDGDTLTVQPVASEGLRVGDVALYRADGERLAAHRLTGRRVDGDCVTFVARGDAATGPGEAVRAEHVLGRVVRVQRGDRFLDLERGIWRVAARLWVATAPLGPLFLEGLGKLKGLAAWFLCRLQAQKPYRRLARRLIGQQIQYRAATAEDAPALSALYAYGNLPYLADPAGTWLEHLKDLEGRGCTLVASLGGRRIGAAIIRQSSEDPGFPSDWWLWGMLVTVRYRGAGIGQELVRKALAVAREAGAGRVYLRVFEENRAALALYRKVGFRPVPATEDGPDRHADSGGSLLVYPMT